MNAVDTGAIMYQLASKDISIATFYLLHNCLGTQAVATLAKKKIREQILDESFTLKSTIGWAITEPANGSKVHTIARKVGSNYVLNGSKKMLGNSTEADYLLVWAKNYSDDGKIQCFVVKKGAKGLSISEEK